MEYVSGIRIMDYGLWNTLIHNGIWCMDYGL